MTRIILNEADVQLLSSTDLFNGCLLVGKLLVGKNPEKLF